MRLAIIIFAGLCLFGCSSKKFDRTVTYVERDKFMGDWYVIAGRFTSIEKDVFNSIETYKWNAKEERIDIDFRFNQGSFDGPLKKIPQKAWIVSADNAHWKVQPFWPLKFDYLIIALAADYRWTAIGVPDQKYLWIMCKDPHFTKEEVTIVLKQLEKKGYNTSDIVFVPHQY